MIVYVYRGKEHKGTAGERLVLAALSDYMSGKWPTGQGKEVQEGGLKGQDGLGAPHGPDDIPGFIRRTPAGKPYIEGLPVHFSVSHSGSLWVCLAADFPVGVDIQLAKELPYEKLAKRFFTEEETAYVQQEGAKAFFQVWTRKEAYVKYTGLGFSGQGFSTFSVVERRKGGSGEWQLASRIGNGFVKALDMAQEPSTGGFSLLPGEKIFGSVCGNQLEDVQIKVL